MDTIPRTSLLDFPSCRHRLFEFDSWRGFSVIKRLLIASSQSWSSTEASCNYLNEFCRQSQMLRLPKVFSADQFFSPFCSAEFPSDRTNFSSGQKSWFDELCLHNIFVRIIQKKCQIAKSWYDCQFPGFRFTSPSQFYISLWCCLSVCLSSWSQYLTFDIVS